MTNPKWETVEVPPAGRFIGWGVREGQHITGKVTDYDPTGGSDYNGNTCPQIEIELTEKASSFNKKLDRTFIEPGELVVVTCGSYELERGIKAAEPAVGDLIKIRLDGADDIEGGKTVKRFSFQIARGQGKRGDRPNVKVVKSIEPDAATPVDDDIPF
jgi:hypothetical protein